MSDKDKKFPRRVLLVSYFFYPSTEVGAKRTSELALSLQDAGATVKVIHARSRELIPTDDALLDKVRSVSRHSVVIPPKIVDRAWAAIKALKPRQPQKSQDAASGDAIPDLSKPVPSGPPRLSFVQVLRRQYLAFETLFGGRKFWALLVWVRVLYLRLFSRAEVVVSSGPPMVSYLGGIFASWVNACPWVMDMRDPWFLNRRAGHLVEGHWLMRIEDWAARQCIRRSDAIVCASPGIARYLQRNFTEYRDNAVVIRNGFDAEAVLTDSGPVGSLSMLYCGTLYLNRNPFPFLEALVRVLNEGIVERSLVRFLFVGNCSAWNGISLTGWLREHGIDDVVTVRDFVTASELSTLVADANVLVNFSQGQSDQIPAKTYEYIASGRMFLVIAERDSDSADLIKDIPSGVLVEPSDTRAMEQYLRDLITRLVDENSAYQLPMAVRAEFSRENQNSKYIAFLDELLVADKE